METKTPKPPLYVTGTYYVISRDGVPCLIGKVTRRRASKAVISIINGCWHATFDEIGFHRTKRGAVYLVEAPIQLPKDILDAFDTKDGTAVLPYVERALRIHHKGQVAEEEGTPVPRIFYGKSLADIKGVAPKGSIIFEDRFKDQTFMEYEACWGILNKIDDTCGVICKTSDALKAAPAESVFVRVGRSVRKSDRGAVIQTAITKEHFLLLEY